MGKGSAPRKFSVDHQTFSSNWDAIFGKKNGNQSGTSNQVHSGERTAVCGSESKQSVYRELSEDSKKQADE